MVRKGFKGSQRTQKKKKEKKDFQVCLGSTGILDPIEPIVVEMLIINPDWWLQGHLDIVHIKADCVAG